MDQRIKDLENYLIDNREDEESWLVLGDLLQEKGDSRGELIMLENLLKRTEKKINDLNWSLFEDIPNNDIIKSKTFYNGYIIGAYIETDDINELKKCLGSDIFNLLKDLYLYGEVFNQPKKVFNILNRFKLRSLNISGNHINDEDIKLLASFPVVTNLEHLSIYRNDITKDGVKTLLKALIGGKFPLLHRLDISNNDIPYYWREKLKKYVRVVYT